MKINTHLKIKPEWVGEVIDAQPGQATVKLETRPEMVADDRGLVHGGFTFGLADFAAMVAVNDPNVVLGSAETRFLAPVRLSETMEASARVVEEKGKKRIVECSVKTDCPVFEGTFTCFVLDKHVLD